MKFEISKGIPILPNGVGAKPKYPFREMEVGDSFFVPGAKPSVRAAAGRAAERLG